MQSLRFVLYPRGAEKRRGEFFVVAAVCGREKEKNEKKTMTLEHGSPRCVTQMGGGAFFEASKQTCEPPSLIN
jgi:hypothetical protein